MSIDPDSHLDHERLARFLTDRGLLDGVRDVRRIGDGHSNITLLVGDGERRVVVRRPPPPPLPKGGHDVLREARVVGALAGTGVPVAPVLAVAQEGEVADVPLYVMGFVAGEVVTDATPPSLASPDGRRRIGEDVVDALVAMHAVDWRARGLEGFGRDSGYAERQLRGLGRLLEGAVTPPDLHRLGDHLRATVPAERPAAIVHGDYRIGNLMLATDPAARPVAAILDWELATIGDPLADLGYLVAAWATPGTPRHPLTDLGPATEEPGYPTPDELAARYAAATGTALDDLPWFVAFALWRLAVLFAYGRARGEDAYYADPTHVPRFVAAGLRAAGLDADG